MGVALLSTLIMLDISISKKEWLFVALMSFVVIIITTVPFLYGYLNTPEGLYYNGIHFLSPADYPVYYSYIGQIKAGNLLFENLYTSEQSGVKVLNIFWLVVGLVARMFDVSVILMFNIARVFFIPLLMLSLYFIISYYFKQIRQRKLIFILMSFASGIGALLSSVLAPINYIEEGYYNWPMDLWVAESNTFLTMYQSPHFIVSLMLLVWVLFLFLVAVERDRMRYSLIAGFLALLLFQFHPYHVPTIFGIIFVFFIALSIRDRKISVKVAKHGFVLGFLSFPSILYHVLLVTLDPYIANKAFQNLQITTVWWLTIISYGFILLFACIGLFKLLKNRCYRENKYLFLICWFVSQAVIIYLPIRFQRRLTEGWQIPMMLLAWIGMYSAYSFFKRKPSSIWFCYVLNNRLLLVFVSISFIFFSNIHNIIHDFINYTSLSPLFYMSEEKISAMRWLKENSSPDSVIIANIVNGNLIPAFGVRKVFAGHSDETVYFDIKKQALNWFYSGKDSENGYGSREEFLQRYGIDYVYWGRLEKDMGSFDPQKEKYLELVYKQGEEEIYYVKGKKR